MLPAEAIEYLQRKALEDPTMPVFVLIATDAYAPSAIVAWSGLVGSAVDGKPATDNSIIKAITARQLAEEMRAWQEKHYLKVKIPD